MLGMDEYTSVADSYLWNPERYLFGLGASCPPNIYQSKK